MLKNKLQHFNKILFIKSLFVYLLICLFAYSPSKTIAQEKIPPGITVIPSIQNLDLATDPPEYQITYINGTKYPIDLALSVQDFTQLEDGYKISFLEGKDATNYKYSLSSWISFENKNLHIEPGETKSTKVFIDAKRITKGGHYASILAEIKQPESKKQIDLKAIISSLLFVRANTGNEVESGAISSFKPIRSQFDFPKSFNLRFQNNGNVQVIPYGTVEVFNSTGKKVAVGVINEGSLNTIPESIRRYNIEVKPTTKIILPGIYRADVSVHFGKTNQKVNKSIHFITLGGFGKSVLILIAIILIAMIFSYKKIRKNNNPN